MPWPSTCSSGWECPSAAPTARTRRRTTAAEAVAWNHGQDELDRQDQDDPEVQGARQVALQPVRAQPRLHAQVRHLPHLLPLAGARRRDSRRPQGELVRSVTPVSYTHLTL